MSKFDIEINRLIEDAPWARNHDAGTLQMPVNGASGRDFNGVNALLLINKGYDDPRWFTKNQAENLGGTLKEGVEATPVQYWTTSERKPLENGEGFETVKLDKPKSFLAYLYNGEQVEGLPEMEPKPEIDMSAHINKVMENTGINIVDDDKGRAFYSKKNDTIALPGLDNYTDPKQRDADLLHELGHSSAHGERMSRATGPFGSEAFAKEELRAEMASMLNSAKYGLPHNADRHGKYHDQWQEILIADKNELFRAAASAQKIHAWVNEPEQREKLERFNGANREQQQVKQSQEKENSMAQTASAPSDTEKNYIAVPFAQKDEAKELGAKWDAGQKSWYVPEGVDISNFEKWQQQPEQSPQLQHSQGQNPPAPQAPAKSETPAPDPVGDFSSFLKENGVRLENAAIMDGQWHRIGVEGDKGRSQSGSYRGFTDGRPSGQLHNYKTGQTVNWVANGVELSKEDKQKLYLEAEQNRHERAVERKQKQEVAALAANERFLNAKPVKDGFNSAYLDAKGVSGHGLRYEPDGKLLVPLSNMQGNLMNVQAIDKNGEKRFQPDARKQGLHHLIDSNNGLDTKGAVYIAEGYATAASLHEATGRPVFVAFDAGNLKPVAENIRKAMPKADLIIAADNDVRLIDKGRTNIGLEKGMEAANAVKGKLVLPQFTDNQKQQGFSDWNDLKRDSGSKEVLKQINTQLKKGVSKVQDNKPAMAL